MNIISNNCIGGFIYRDIIKEQYKNPFIWSFMKTDPFFDMCENFDTVDFRNVEDHLNDSSIYPENRSGLLIDGKYPLAFHHVWLDPNYPTPTVIKGWGNGINVKCLDPRKYIREKYFKRLSRMNLDDKLVFCFYDASSPTNSAIRLVDACEKQKAHGIIITSMDLNIESDKILFLKSDDNWNKERNGWAPSLLATHSEAIRTFISSIS